MNKPSPSQDTALSVGLLILDAVIIGWFTYRVGINGWADSFADRAPKKAPSLARHYTWFLTGGAIITGGGLLATGHRKAGTLQTLILGAAAGGSAIVAAQ